MNFCVRISIFLKIANFKISYHLHRYLWLEPRNMLATSSTRESVGIMMMCSRPISFAQASLNKTSQLRRGYYCAQVYAQLQVLSLFLWLSYSNRTTIWHDQWKIRRSTDLALRLYGLHVFRPRHRGEKSPTFSTPGCYRDFLNRKTHQLNLDIWTWICNHTC